MDKTTSMHRANIVYKPRGAENGIKTLKSLQVLSEIYATAAECAERAL